MLESEEGSRGKGFFFSPLIKGELPESRHCIPYEDTSIMPET